MEAYKASDPVKSIRDFADKCSGIAHEEILLFDLVRAAEIISKQLELLMKAQGIDVE